MLFARWPTGGGLLSINCYLFAGISRAKEAGVGDSARVGGSITRAGRMSAGLRTWLHLLGAGRELIRISPAGRSPDQSVDHRSAR